MNKELLEAVRDKQGQALVEACDTLVEEMKRHIIKQGLQIESLQKRNNEQSNILFERGIAIRQFRTYCKAQQAFEMKDRSTFGHECKWCANCQYKLRKLRSELLMQTTDCLYSEPK